MTTNRKQTYIFFWPHCKCGVDYKWLIPHVYTYLLDVLSSVDEDDAGLLVDWDEPYPKELLVLQQIEKNYRK